MAWAHNGRAKVLAAYRSYHGSTSTSIHLTGDSRRWPSDTGAAGAVHFFGPFLYRSAFGSTTPVEEYERALAHLEQVILLEGPSTISARLNVSDGDAATGLAILDEALAEADTFRG
jgi:taurine---2-oxoglutarate transaminase